MKSRSRLSEIRSRSSILSQPNSRNRYKITAFPAAHDFSPKSSHITKILGNFGICSMLGAVIVFVMLSACPANKSGVDKAKGKSAQPTDVPILATTDINEKLPPDIKSKELFLIKDKGKIGFIDSNGSIAIAAKYDYANLFYEDLACIAINGKYGYINKRGDVVISLLYDSAGDFHEGYANVQSGKLWGYIDTMGKWLVEPKYDSAWEFSEGLARIRIGLLYGFIGKEGIFIRPNFREARDFKEGLAKVKAAEKDISGWGYINKQGKWIIEPFWNLAWSFSEGLACVLDDYHKVGYITPTGAFAIKPQFGSAGYFFDGIAFYNIGGKLVDQEGSTSGGKFGFIDKNGNPIIPAQYDMVKNFSEGVAAVQINQKFGFIDIHNKQIIPPRFDDAGAFDRGLALVSENSKIGYIDHSGKYIWREE